MGQHGIVLPLEGEFNVFLWLPFMWSGGGVIGECWQAVSRGSTLVNQGAIAAQFWRNLIEDGSGVLSLPEQGFEIDGFLKGSVAMQLTGP